MGDLYDDDTRKLVLQNHIGADALKFFLDFKKLSVADIIWLTLWAKTDCLMERIQNAAYALHRWGKNARLK